MLTYLNEFLKTHGIRPKLLIVDDQVMNIQVIREIFKADYDVFFAMNGQQGIEQVRNLMPDLILLDVVMPDMDGYSVCTLLKDDPATANIPIIFITGKQSQDDELEGFQRGGSDFITKPINPLLVQARVAAHLAGKLQADLLKALTSMDGLTGVANRSRFNEAYEANWTSCIRQQLPLSLVFVDIDFFKQLNDAEGHSKGDECLKQVAQIMKQVCRRPMDLAARYAAEEFALVLPGTSLEGATLIAEEIQKTLATAAIPHPDSKVSKQVTLSIGVATVTPNEKAQKEILIQSVDLQLYLAKEMGKNQISVIDLDEHQAG
ncbi:diguanylate cyclase [Leeia sp. TBRC 13508]|uniref:diguanylate cyclase n=1 Tax=Leeia speluncae TaxID=2884804 RepID=A0ABS8D3W5_9NEIS|nr:diguanylate cyclase [Leeia speluncae]MCB6182887.1 diguanylate cyclase [Leeia speluncae]